MEVRWPLSVLPYTQCPGGGGVLRLFQVQTKLIITIKEIALYLTYTYIWINKHIEIILNTDVEQKKR